jgi:tRNA (cmo5U34)-methyltransferase
MDKIAHIPEGKWQFDAEVTTIFEDMLQRSIPQYEVMRKAVTDIAVQYAADGSYIVDLGCSRGDAIASCIDSIGDRCQYLGIDISLPMVEAAQVRFKDSSVRIENFDLRSGYPSINNACIVLSILTIQFTPIEYRQRIVRDIFKSLHPGGVLILVEKVLGNTADIDKTMVDLYYALKGEHGYSSYEVERKRLSLEGVLVPVTAKWNEELLRNAGFEQIDTFWRWMNFAGFLAIKT